MTIHYVNDFPINLNEAPSLHVFEVCKNLHMLGERVVLINPGIEKGGIKLPFVHVSVASPRVLRSVFFQLSLVLTIRKLWSTEKPDVLYVRSGMLLIVPTILSLFYKVNLVTELNGTLEEEVKASKLILPNLLRALRVLRFIEGYNCRNSQAVITVSSGLRDYIIKKYRLSTDKVVVIENGVDSNVLAPSGSAKKLHHITIGYVGGLMWWQGLDYVIRAMPKITKAFPETRFVIVGDGPENAKLQKIAFDTKCSASIDFMGPVNHEKVPALINSFDLCVAYYVRERANIISPFKVFEYLSCGKPTIVSNIQGVGDKFADVAKVVEPQDTAQLAKSIIGLIKDKKERDRLGKAGREFIVQGHTWQTVSKAIVEVLEQ